MTGGPEWFAPKRYGIGSGLPIRWQGWLILAIFTGVITFALVALQAHPDAMLAVVIPATLLLMLICARTTRGGWRWRWGDPD